MNCWKQEPHIIGGLLRDPHEGSAVGQTFLQKFYAGESCFCVLRWAARVDVICSIGRDEESVRIASP
jgi:hypothetical protein